MGRNGGSKSFSKTESQFMLLLSCKMSMFRMMSFQQEGIFENRGEGRRDFKDACNSFAETLEPCVTVYMEMQRHFQFYLPMLGD